MVVIGHPPLAVGAPRACALRDPRPTIFRAPRGRRTEAGGVALSPAWVADMAAQLRTSVEVPRKAAGIVKDYVLDLYFPALRLTPWQRLRCTPLIFLVEYLIYRVDTVAEQAREIDLRAADADQTVNRYEATFKSYKATIEAILRCTSAHNEAVARYIELGEQYLYLENKVTSNRVAAHDEVLQLAELRPSDVRLLHAMTYSLLGRPVDHELLDLLWPVEVLADIGNDLSHYRQDIAVGRYNTYDAFVRLYGRSAPSRLRVEIARYERQFRAELAKFPDRRRAELAALCTRRYLARTKVIPEPHVPHGRDSTRREPTP
jgi:hypothetical protein